LLRDELRARARPAHRYEEIAAIIETALDYRRERRRGRYCDQELDQAVA
jgi:hypothetical protein